MRTAIITGGTRGLGRALVERLTADGWSVIFDARRREDVEDAASAINNRSHSGAATGITGDVGDPRHRDELAGELGDRPLDLLVNNAGTLGPTPLPRFADLDEGELAALFHTNVLAPFALTRRLLDPLERGGGIIVNISSDAAVEAYSGWGGYGASKAALDHITRVFAAEHPSLSCYSFDPGDMRTDMHQAAFPGEDISDRPAPSLVVPSIVRIIEMRPASGRYTAADLSARPALR